MDENEVEQYSTVSAERLQEAAARLVTVVRSFTTEAVAMRGGTSELAALFQRNEALEAVVDALAEAAFDHTGTFPFVLAGRYEEDDSDEVDEEPEDEEPVALLSVVSRWDVAVSSTDRLLEAGRAAHRSNRPEETAEDAAAAVSNEPAALYAILHERGEPWFEIPGIHVISGARAYVQPSSAAEPYDGDPDTLLDAVRAPEGSALHGESW